MEFSGEEDGEEDDRNSWFLRQPCCATKRPPQWDPSCMEKGGSGDYVDDDGNETPWIESRVELRRRWQQRRAIELNEDEGATVDLLQDTDEVDICMPKTDEILNFLHGAHMEALRGEKWTRQEELPEVAWIEESSFRGGTRRSRPNKGPLTAHGLYRQLRKRRFISHGGPALHTRGANSGFGPDRASDTNPRGRAAAAAVEAKARAALVSSMASTDIERSSSCSSGDPHVPAPVAHEPGDDEVEVESESDADRQLIYVQGLDRWTASALIGSVSIPLAPALRDALYSHLASETFVGVTLPAQGPWVFRFELHLPFPVWSRSLKPREDLRRGQDGEPLRHYTDVTFLNWGDGPEREYIYEGHVSCVVVGSNRQIWSAYCFEDKYFESPDTRQTVRDYYEDSLGPEGAPMDPLTNGEFDANYTPQKPEEYLLAVLWARTKQIYTHWLQVKGKQKQSIKVYKRVSASPSPCDSRSVEECASAIKRYMSGIQHARYKS
ncbi:hypothetical protein A1O1_07350 [Capronia coronata CBS 617.96]|uniref:Uncharacterized protein n=1 Tax=Capronia coronata CBS 617.96 TaxID=1182541 RepID=W9YN80_9EURO|nr:uncharacterized protein A1O1_07350 [Capronia coronata CBS 617.96]EXJ83724.1 hypothetical protein A1O1_07350 [Capronia coronata CBS 617.96]